MIDVPLDRDLKPGIKIHVSRHFKCPEQIVAVSLGVHVPGYNLPIPATNDHENCLVGFKKRQCYKTPDISHKCLEELRGEARRFCHNYLTPLSADADASIETWLLGTSYNEERKNVLRQTLIDEPLMTSSHYKNKSHIKLEKYSDGGKFKYKCPRIINSRTDRYKIEVGPYVKLIEHEVYKLPFFRKHVPVRDLPKYIMENTDATGCFLSTDHTSFESHVISKIQKCIEWEVYKYMLKRLPRSNEILTYIHDGQMGKQTCVTKLGVSVIMPDGCRMSGDMTTSLGNGLTNLIVYNTICRKKKISSKGVVEGDDGIFSLPCPIIHESDFERYGFDVKMQYSESVGKAGFCGLIFDEHDQANITDPVDELISFGWTCANAKMGGSKVRKELLRSKCFSLIYEFPNCPIIRAFADYIYRCVGPGSLRIDESTQWWNEQVMMNITSDLPNGDIGYNSRLLMEREFGFSVSEQLALEDHFNRLTKLKPIKHPILESHFNKHKLYIDCCDRFVRKLYR